MRIDPELHKALTIKALIYNMKSAPNVAFVNRCEYACRNTPTCFG